MCSLQLDGLFSDTEYLGASPLDFCASQPLAIKYIWAITFEWQAYHLLKCARPPPHCLEWRHNLCPTARPARRHSDWSPQPVPAIAGMLTAHIWPTGT